MSSESRGVGDSTSVSDLVVQERSQASRGLTAENAKLPTFCSRYFRARKRMHCPCCGTGSMPTHSLCLSPSPGSFKVRPSRISILLFLPPPGVPLLHREFCRMLPPRRPSRGVQPLFELTFLVGRRGDPSRFPDGSAYGENQVLTRLLGACIVHALLFDCWLLRGSSMQSCMPWRSHLISHLGRAFLVSLTGLFLVAAASARRHFWFKNLRVSLIPDTVFSCFEPDLGVFPGIYSFQS